MNNQSAPDLILHNGRITTLDPKCPEAKNLAVQGGRIVGVNDAEAYPRGPDTKVIDLRGRRVIPGLNDSHLHVIRAGLNYNLELRWDGVPSLADALRILQEQARRTPPPHWVRVIGGWNEWQFAEKRMPTLEELNKAAPDTPVIVLHLYDCAMLNRAAIRALGMNSSTPNPPEGLIARDASGEPTGLLIAEPNAFILYTQGSAWFSGEVQKKGTLAAGQFADLAVLNDDYLACADAQIRQIESVLTVCDGKIVYAANQFAALSLPLPPVSPDWSPAGRYGGYDNAPLIPHNHTPVFGADGRLWEMGCGCAV